MWKIIGVQIKFRSEEGNIILNLARRDNSTAEKYYNTKITT